MKIAFDQQVFLLQKYGGISRYICNLSKVLDQQKNIQSRIFAPLNFNENLHPNHRLTKSGLLLPTLPPKLTRLSMEVSKYLARGLIQLYSPDILHETYYTLDDFQLKNTKRILTVYDFIHERYPNMFDHAHITVKAKKAAVSRSDHVICISKSTQRDLIKFCGISKEKTSVIYLGVDDIFNQKDKFPNPYINEEGKPYLLYVGGRAGYKNFNSFLSAFSNSIKLRNDFNIVFFGGGDITNTELNFAKHNGISPNQFLQYRGSDQLLAQLYRDASAFIYPSLYEGFGLPPLEAMACSCPVISSNTSSMPEVIGNAGEYFNPNSSEDIQQAIEAVIYSPSRIMQLKEKGMKRVKLFGWDKCAKETLDVYKKITKDSK